MAKRAKTSKIGIQVGVVPYRWHNSELQVCLITSRRGHWGFPKGNIDSDESPWQAAVRECLEEAGLKGRIDGPPFAIYKYQKSNRRFDVSTYLMCVDETCDTWLEANARQRIWVSPAEARRLIRRVGVCEVMERAIQQVLANSSRDEVPSRKAKKRGTAKPAAMSTSTRKAGKKVAKAKKAVAKKKSGPKTKVKNAARSSPKKTAVH